MEIEMKKSMKRNFRVTALISEAENKTSTARSLGYKGQRSVLVLDGKVISHSSVDWAEFCSELKGSNTKESALSLVAWTSVCVRVMRVMRDIKNSMGRPFWKRSFV